MIRDSGMLGETLITEQLTEAESEPVTLKRRTRKTGRDAKRRIQTDRRKKQACIYSIRRCVERLLLLSAGNGRHGERGVVGRLLWSAVAGYLVTN